MTWIFGELEGIVSTTYVKIKGKVASTWFSFAFSNTVPYMMTLK